ncbi:hypothetical protein Golax_010792, partial [Gossypium laxum]|nr:hypothetical protein [Gossypium laxum]
MRIWRLSTLDVDEWGMGSRTVSEVPAVRRMGTNGNEEVTSLYSLSCRDRRFSKHIHDNVHGNIYLDP